MKKNGAQLAVYALEQIGVKNTFGIPGVHNTELYDALNTSEQIQPILVTHEGCASLKRMLFRVLPVQLVFVRLFLLRVQLMP